MNKSLIQMILLIFFTHQAFADYPAQVVRCDVPHEDSGQGIAYRLLVNYSDLSFENGLAVKKPNCDIAVYYGTEYGSEVGFDEMYSMTVLKSKNMTCEVSSDGALVISNTVRARGKPPVTTKLTTCKLKKDR